MFVKSFYKKIDKAMEKDDPREVWKLIKEAVHYFAEKINSTLNAIDKRDIPFAIVALDAFREALLSSTSPEEQQNIEKIVADILSRCEVSMEVYHHRGPITEAAAKEIYERAKLKKE